MKKLICVFVVMLVALTFTGVGYAEEEYDYWDTRVSERVRDWGWLGVPPEWYGVGVEIAGTDLDNVYRTERWAVNFSILFELAAGTYDFAFMFSENFEPAGRPGERVFDVMINGEVVLPAVDIYSAVEDVFTAYEVFVEDFVIEDEGDGFGLAWVEFEAISSGAKVNGIAIYDKEGNEVAFINAGGPEDDAVYFLELDF